MKCDTCREMLTGYLKSELDEAQIMQVEEHLASCAECAAESEGARKVLALTESASAPAVREVVDRVIAKAVENRASDIHVQRRSEGGMIRLRVDGVLHDEQELDLDMHRAVVDRLKLLGGVSLTHRLTPQDGRCPLRLKDRDYDLRVSVVPGLLGETVVVRILDTSVARLSLEQVCLVGEQRRQLDELICSPMGMVYVTGPSGSGKTTTLYAILNELNKPDVHVMSIENPVEYQFDGITQISVNPQTGVDFKTAMRGAMRQDPDIIMCGEIRDLETLELCMQAAIWGHLVLTTLHTLDAVSSLRRLLDVGADRFMVTQTFLGATAQRLLRRVCPDCKEEYEATEAERVWLQAAGGEAPAKLWRGRGCARCNQTGCRGRAAAYEILVADAELTEMLTKNAPIDEIEKMAAKKIKSMRTSAAEMVVAGTVSAAEAMRVTAFMPVY